VRPPYNAYGYCPDRDKWRGPVELIYKEARMRLRRPKVAQIPTYRQCLQSNR